VADVKRLLVEAPQGVDTSEITSRKLH